MQAELFAFFEREGSAFVEARVVDQGKGFGMHGPD
jgi:hypothetical protein